METSGSQSAVGSSRLGDPKAPMVQMKSLDSLLENPPFLGRVRVRAVSFCSIQASDLQLIEQEPPTLGKAICLTQSTIVNVNTIQTHSK